MTDDILTELAQRDLERLRGYQALLDFYHGNQWEGRGGRSEKRLTFNYAKVFVDKMAAYLMSGLSFAVDPMVDSPAARAQAQRAEEALARVYAANSLEQLDLETEIDGAILGDGCYKVTWDPQMKAVRVTAPDVQGVYAWWRGDDAARIWRVASRYELGTEETGYLYGVKPAGKTATLIEIWTDGGLVVYLDGNLLEKRPNPYGFIPFIIYPNLREPKQLWGVSDLPPLMAPQRELNRALSQLSHILELSGNPIAVLENVEQSQDIAVRPGAVWNIPEEAKAYLLDLLQGGGVRLHMDYIDLLYRTLHDLSESPRAAFGGTDRDLSGVALELELNPLLQKVRRKWLIRTAVFNRRNRIVLDLLERFTGVSFGEVRLRVVWAPVLPQDVTRQVTSEQALIQSGIHSRRRAMDELGVPDPEQEFRRWLEEREIILRMNRELGTRPGRGNGRERASDVPAWGADQFKEEA